MPSYAGMTKTYAISMPPNIPNQVLAGIPKMVIKPDMDKANATERKVGDKDIVNNVVTHISSLTDAANQANDIQNAGIVEKFDIMPQIPEWPEVGDILSVAIAKAYQGRYTAIDA